MRADKVILRAFLSTLIAIAALMAFLLITLLCVYPSTMMEITYDLGMNQSSVRNATRAYNRTDDIYYIAYATDVAIESDDYKKIVSCGKRLISDDEFADYCEKKNETWGAGAYEQYVYGQVCVAEYKGNKKTQAVARAFELNGISFAKNNAVAAVLLVALREKDADTVEMIKGKMEQLQGEDLSAADGQYLAEMLALVEKTKMD